VPFDYHSVPGELPAARAERDAAQLRSPGTSAIFTVTGAVTLGATLTVNGTGAPFPTGRTYLIIANDGTDPIIGTFAGLPQGATIVSGGQTFIISYTGGTGNDVILTAIDPIAAPALGPAALLALGLMIAIAALATLRR
jgi:hypothetical protein